MQKPRAKGKPGVFHGIHLFEAPYCLWKESKLNQFIHSSYRHCLSADRGAGSVLG